ncbi:MAG TPA: LysR family transcriptional regulator, partial [Croceibacterium sp.]|nr:LysR family transcriptional regulator [Croceibacterium sp.]
LNEAAFAAAGHVAVRIDGRNTYIENELGRLGLARRIEVYAPSFIQAPWLLPGTPRIALMHERLARLMAPMLGLVIADAPFAIPTMREMMQYHAAQEADPGLGWLRSELREATGPSTAAEEPSGPA